jgi:LAO/AO transport system kinase
MELLSDLKKGKRGAIAKAISIVENDQVEAKKLNKTAIAMRKLRTKPAVLAIDPTSHVTGGAILGDRVRMSESTDSGTYIRSIASRGATGAVSRSLRNSIRILEYAGFNPIIIESVGAGQTEVEISNIADITVVVFNPNTGDSIQTIKAGLTEIGDIYLVNKSDLDGTNQLFDAVRDFIGASERNPVILKTSVKKNTGIIPFAKLLKEMMASKKKSKKEKDQERLETELKDIVLNNLKERMDELLDSDKTFSKYLKKLIAKDIDPFEAADKITKSMVK